MTLDIIRLNTPSTYGGIKIAVEQIVLASAYILLASYYILLSINLLMI